jgi:hypothetical protein
MDTLILFVINQARDCHVITHTVLLTCVLDVDLLTQQNSSYVHKSEHQRNSVGCVGTAVLDQSFNSTLAKILI